MIIYSNSLDSGWTTLNHLLGPIESFDSSLLVLKFMVLQFQSLDFQSVELLSPREASPW